MSGVLRFETMAARDIDSVRSIDAVAYPNPWSVATWRKELAADDRVHLVAVDGDEVVGHAGLLFVLDEAHVTTVATAAAHEGRGIATALLVRLLRAARQHGSVSATLEVRAADRRPQRLYGRFGFRPAGVRRNYYRDPTDDGIVMWLHDLDSDETTARLEALDSPHPMTATGEPA
ncbi:MAG: ribosomal protein S18-alanine N-acetyltransferase [Acidimicrobiales bacterium]